jgi:putative membrane protein
MLWFKALHIIFVVTWFSGLFYLPRLFVYHAMANDAMSLERFKIMERKLYYGIATPSAILATFFGLAVLSYGFSGYMHQPWMHLKLAFVTILWFYHILCGKYLYNFKNDNNHHSHTFYRWFNEVPTVLLFVIVILVVVKPIFLMASG